MPIARPVYDSTATPAAPSAPVTPSAPPETGGGPLITPDMRESMRRNLELMEFQRMQQISQAGQPRPPSAQPSSTATAGLAGGLGRIRQTVKEIQELQVGLAELGIGADNPVETILNSQFMGTFGQGLGQVVSQMATAWRERSNYEHQLKVSEQSQEKASKRWREDVQLWRETMQQYQQGGAGMPPPPLPGPPSPTMPGVSGEMGGFQVPWNPTGTPPQMPPAAPPYAQQAPQGPYDPMAPQGGMSPPPMGPPGMGGFPQRPGARYRMEPDPGMPGMSPPSPQGYYPPQPPGYGQQNPYQPQQQNPYTQMLQTNEQQARELQEAKDRLAIYESGGQPGGPESPESEPPVLEEGDSSDRPDGVDPSLMGTGIDGEVQENPKKKPRGK
jgi:hypothetical protein